MPVSFFVEFRLRGYARKYADWVKWRAQARTEQLGIRRSKAEKGVSHITLFGPAQARNINQVISEINIIGHRYTLVPFAIGGISRFDNKTSKVIYLDVVPSAELEQFRSELAQCLLKIASTDSPFDSKKRIQISLYDQKIYEHER
jgi:2'-5' RNA ligase